MALRYHITDRVLQLAQALQSSRIGLSLADIQRQFRVSRRTAQRLRDAIIRNYPQTEQIFDEERRPRWRIPSPHVGSSLSVSAEQIADLETTARYFRQRNLHAKAKSLENLANSIKASLPARQQARLEPDVEVLLEAEGLAMRPGPRPQISEEVINTLRLAIKEGSEISIQRRVFNGGKTDARRIQPYGFLFGRQHYLVGVSPDRHPAEHRIYALSSLKKVVRLPSRFVRDPGFSLEAFAQRSFGVYQEPPQSVVWKFKPAVAEAAMHFQFHPTQVVKRQRDKSVLVTFTAGGFVEMCWHLYTWGDNVEVVSPPALKTLMASALKHNNFDLERPRLPTS
jgi:predicted DNA-binding transcriptional regulator YafY